MDEEDQVNQEFESAKITEMKKLRACMRCHLIKSEKQWKEEEKCQNCPFFEDIVDSKDFVAYCTTPNFEGMIAIMKPRESWVAKRQRLQKMITGLYCLKTHTDLSEDIANELQDRQILILN